MAPRTKVIAGDKQFSFNGNDHLETSELSLDPNEPKTKTFESRYFVPNETCEKTSQLSTTFKNEWNS